MTDDDADVPYGEDFHIDENLAAFFSRLRTLRRGRPLSHSHHDCGRLRGHHPEPRKPSAALSRACLRGRQPASMARQPCSSSSLRSENRK
jgi:hypothetical protein